MNCTSKCLTVVLISLLSLSCSDNAASKNTRPNILLCIADDWGWPHAGIYGDPSVKTPTFDRLANEGVLFNNAFVSSPSCTPSRSAILSGQFHWRLEESANLWSTLNAEVPVYPLILEDAGYFVGSWRKAWGPGNIEAGGYTDRLPAGKKYKGFSEFLDERPEGKPFCFWLGASDPHRPYKEGSGIASGIDINKIKVPGFYPDVDQIRSDIADYYFEVQRFDNDVARALELLEQIGELDNTIVVMTGDHGMPFPRSKGNLYDIGVRVPLAIRWGAKVKGNRKIDDFVSLTDLAPTFLKASGEDIPGIMTGNSLIRTLLSGKSAWIERSRKSVVFGRERHTPAQQSPSMAGYPSRGIRTEKYLYIRNFEPDRWPAGVPDGATHPMNSFADCDNGPTKSFLIENKDHADYKLFYDLSFSKRGEEELYNIENDPDQIINLASNPDYLKIKQELAKELDRILKETADPRVTGGGEIFDKYPYRASYSLR